MGFVSFGDAGGPPPFDPTRGPNVYVIHGQAYHRISSLYPNKGEKPRFGQVYIFDPADAAAVRAQWHDGLDPDLLESLHRELRGLPNPFATAYRNLHDVLRVVLVAHGLADHARVAAAFPAGAPGATAAA